ncbi:MAG: hypothetical protein ACREM1_04555 [Longimicrobiales bacterium]
MIEPSEFGDTSARTPLRFLLAEDEAHADPEDRIVPVRSAEREREPTIIAVRAECGTEREAEIRVTRSLITGS